MGPLIPLSSKAPLSHALLAYLLLIQAIVGRKSWSSFFFLREQLECDEKRLHHDHAQSIHYEQKLLYGRVCLFVLLQASVDDLP